LWDIVAVKTMTIHYDEKTTVLALPELNLSEVSILIYFLLAMAHLATPCPLKILYAKRNTNLAATVRFIVTSFLITCWLLTRRSGLKSSRLAALEASRFSLFSRNRYLRLEIEKPTCSEFRSEPSSCLRLVLFWSRMPFDVLCPAHCPSISLRCSSLTSLRTAIASAQEIRNETRTPLSLSKSASRDLNSNVLAYSILLNYIFFIPTHRYWQSYYLY
jgi:hypothetical protein